MDAVEKNLLQLLADNGFQLAREKRHRVFKNPSGKIWVMPATASDHHAYHNNLENFRRYLSHGIAKSGSVQLGIDAEARRRADSILHPARPRKIKPLKERRIVQKKLWAPVLEATKPTKPPQRPPQPTKPTKPDLYKVGRAVSHAIRPKIMGGYKKSFAAAVNPKVEEAGAKYRAMQDAGASADELRKYRRDTLSIYFGLAGTLAKEIPRMINAIIRTFQVAVRDGCTPETDGEIIHGIVDMLIRRTERRCSAEHMPEVVKMIVDDCWEAVAPFYPSVKTTATDAGSTVPMQTTPQLQKVAGSNLG